MSVSSLTRNTQERCIQFLNESNFIESITEIDYHNKAYQTEDQGHYGAFLQSQADAMDHKPLTAKTIMQWQKMIAEEQVRHGHHIDERGIGHIRGPALRENVRIGAHIPPSYEEVPTLFDYLIENINEALKSPDTFKDDVEYCKLLGRSFQQFESNHPFIDVNGRVGRLIANYIATFCDRPIIVFQSEKSERNKYYDAHKSEKDMQVFMAKKIQETIFALDGQTILFKDNASSNSTVRYVSLDRKTEESYEWHPLVFAAESWKSEIEK